MSNVFMIFAVIAILLVGTRLAYYRDYIRKNPNSKIALKAEAKKWVKEAKRFKF